MSVAPFHVISNLEAKSDMFVQPPVDSNPGVNSVRNACAEEKRIAYAHEGLELALCGGWQKVV